MRVMVRVMVMGDGESNGEGEGNGEGRVVETEEGGEKVMEDRYAFTGHARPR